MRNRLLLLVAFPLVITQLSVAQGTGTNPPPLPLGVHLDASMAIDDVQGSTYVPVDSWIYDAVDRLHALGYLDTAYLGLKPWTRISIAHMLELSSDQIESDAHNDEARSIYVALVRDLKPDIDRSVDVAKPKLVLESAYSRVIHISGTPLHDSFHLGSTIVNDYGRPYEQGFDNVSGFSARASAGRFSFYFRGEGQYAPSATGYSDTLAASLSENIDGLPFNAAVPMETLPSGSIASLRKLRVLEAMLSYHLLGHEISIGKGDHWLGPAKGASMLWGNNAENSYEFEINRTEPLYVPGLSHLTGPFRYDFFVGAMQGHTEVLNPSYQADPSTSIPNVLNPGNPWVNMAKISFKPTRNLEFGFDRMAIWGGKGHEPITIHTFLRSFFSFQNVPTSEKFSSNDPGYRQASFDFTYRLPFLNHWITLYTDSLVHDDVSSISNPPRAAWRPGVYIARFPHLEQLDLRVEGATTDTSVSSVQSGQFLYWEFIQRQGPTNNGNLVGDWVGRQGKGGQAWLTYHVTPQEEIQFQYRNAKAASAFIPGGTTQNDFTIEAVKRIRKDFEAKGWVQFEYWKAPIYKTGLQNDTVASFQFTWYPPEHAQ